MQNIVCFNLLKLKPYMRKSSWIIALSSKQHDMNVLIICNATSYKAGGKIGQTFEANIIFL